MLQLLEKKIGIRWTHRIFKFIRTVYLILDICLSSTVGYSLIGGWKKEQNKGTGHLVKIVERSTENAACQNFLTNFILQHDSYVDPIEYVLKNDCVTLMGASETQVWFCVSPNVNVYDLKVIPFAFLAQYLFAEKLLIVDISTLHKIASKLEGPNGNCIMINNTSRCGSTLLCQVNQG